MPTGCKEFHQKSREKHEQSLSLDTLCYLQLGNYLDETLCLHVKEERTTGHLPGLLLYDLLQAFPVPSSNLKGTDSGLCRSADGCTENREP